MSRKILFLSFIIHCVMKGCIPNATQIVQMQPGNFSSLR